MRMIVKGQTDASAKVEEEEKEEGEDGERLIGNIGVIDRDD